MVSIRSSGSDSAAVEEVGVPLNLRSLKMRILARNASLRDRLFYLNQVAGYKCIASMTADRRNAPYSAVSRLPSPKNNTVGRKRWTPAP